MTQDTMVSGTTPSSDRPGESTMAVLRGTAVHESPQDLYTLFSQAARQRPDRLALISLYQSNNLLPSVNDSCQTGSSNELRWTYAQLLNGANCLAASLHSQGVRVGDTVAVFLENSAEVCLLLWAAARLRARFVPLDPRSLSRSSDVKHYITALQPCVIVVRDETSAQIMHTSVSKQIHGAIKIVTCHSQTTPPLPGWQVFADLVASSKYALLQFLCAEQHMACLRNDIGLAVFTSGTTNLPKACPHTYQNIWYETNNIIHFRQVNYSHVLLHHLPISHVFGVTNLMAFWRVGAAVVLPSASFDAKASLDALKKEEITQMPSVPSIIQALSDTMPEQGIHFKALGNIHLGGTVISPHILAQCTEPSKLAARSVSIGFGLSEGMSMFGWEPGEIVLVENNFASVGKIAPAGLAKICASNSRQVLQRGEVGELHIGGEMVIRGYLNLDSDAFYQDDEGVQWFVTGDQAKIVDCGAVYILGRYKDIIIRAGENISPSAIESCLETFPGILESQVVGVKDEYAGELPVAVVRIEDGSRVPHADMNNYVKSELGLASAPVRIFTLQELGLSALPLTTSGKVRKTVLRQVVQDHMVKNQSVSQTLTVQRHGDPEANLTKVWSRLLGLLEGEVPLDTPIKFLADSIIVLQFRSIMKREFGLDVSLDSSDETTIRSQGSRINMIEKDKQHVVTSSRRDGPPAVEDMVHVLGEENGLARTIQVAERVLQAMNLDWNRDVEDVFPVPDTYSRFTTDTRPNAWNLRWIMVASDTDARKLRHALEVSLSRWPLMRALLVDHEGSVPLYLVIRSQARQMTDRCIERTDTNVSTVKELKELVLPAPSYARRPGPLFRSSVVTINDTGAVGVVVQIFHSAFDATSFKAWQDDFHNVLYNQKESPQNMECSYKYYADAYYLYRKSPLAAASIAFHANRWRGVSQRWKGIWPKQQASHWFIGSDADYTPDTNVATGVPSTRTPLNPDRTLGAIGINRMISLPHIGRIKELHNIAAPLVLLTACTLFNLHKTGQQTIAFGNIQASRAWPFVPDWISKGLPNPMDIPGPTFEAFLAITTIADNSESVLSLMKRIDQDQTECSKWPHVPIALLRQGLGEDGRVYNDCLRRQAFNWLHTWQGELHASRTDGMTVLQSERMFDMGVFWNCGMVSADTLRMCAFYDDCQVTNEEMSEATDCLLAIAEWIHRPEHWGRSVADCLAARDKVLQ